MDIKSVGFFIYCEKRASLALYNITIKQRFYVNVSYLLPTIHINSKGATMSVDKA